MEKEWKIDFSMLKLKEKNVIENTIARFFGCSRSKATNILLNNVYICKLTFTEKDTLKRVLKEVNEEIASKIVITVRISDKYVGLIS